MHISELYHMRDDKRIKFKDESVGNEKFTIVSYMISDSSLWSIPKATECRGITFDVDGNCVSRPFEKFFSVGENESTQLHRVIDTGITGIYEKRDGSMLTPVIAGGKVHYKTKKSFYSEIAVLANEIANSCGHVPQVDEYISRDKSRRSNISVLATALQQFPGHVNIMSAYLLSNGWTPIFEFTHSDNRVVLDYGNTQPFTLLAIRRTKSGEYMDWHQVVYTAKFFQVPLIGSYPEKNIDDILFDKMSMENFEGYVLTLVDGSRVKLKTDWYIRNHRIRTDMRVRDVAEMVVDETVDDVKISASNEGLDLQPIIDIENQVTGELSMIQSEVERVVKACDGLDVKTIAIAYNSHAMFSLIMRAVRGGEPDYIAYWKRNYLSDYCLKAVYNSKFTGDA